MDKFFVIEVVYTSRERKQTFFKKYKYAGPFGTELEARVIADAKNAAIQDPSESMSFYHVGTVDDIGTVGLIVA